MVNLTQVRTAVIGVLAAVAVFTAVPAAHAAPDPCPSDASIRVTTAGAPVWTPKLKRQVLTCAAFAKKNNDAFVIRTATVPDPANTKAASRVRNFIKKNMPGVKVVEAAAPIDYPQNGDVLYFYWYAL